MKDARTITHCRLCSSMKLQVFLDLGETALANELVDSPDVEQDTFPLQLAQCGACEHVQLTVAVDPKRLFPPTYPYQSGTSPVFREHLSRLAMSQSMHAARGALDIGCNDGTFLNELRVFDYAVLGVEPSTRRAADAALDGVPVIAEPFTHELAKRIRSGWEWRGASGRFGLITALNVFAHVDDLHDFTAGVAELLADDGVFIFEVGYLPDIVERGNLGVIYHEHLDYHHVTPLREFFSRFGLKLTDAHRVDSQGGSVRCFVVRDSYEINDSIALHELLEEENANEALYRAKLEQWGAKRLEGLGVEIVSDADAREWAVCGYGAPAKLTTLMRVMRLDATDIECIFDDNPLKVGKYTPGTHIPIVSSAELMQRNPDALVLFSANFADEIKSRFPDWKGEWIVP